MKFTHSSIEKPKKPRPFLVGEDVLIRGKVVWLGEHMDHQDVLVKIPGHPFSMGFTKDGKLHAKSPRALFHRKAKP